MKIAVVGLWHSGEVYSACLAELGNNIIRIDKNNKIVNYLSSGNPPLAEPGLQEILKRNIQKGRLEYTTNFNSISKCDVLWITIDTPIDEAAHGNLSKIFTYIKESLPFIKNGAILIVSSQLPVGTSQKIIKFIKANKKNIKFDYAYIPENLQPGNAVNSFMAPSRIVIGTDSAKRLEVIIKIFKKLKTNILTVNIASAEMVKHATNAFLATSLSFIYDIADVCEKVGADVTEVSRSLRADSRIGEKAYLDASAGFSGGHLERDLQYLRKIAKEQKLNLPVISSVLKKNKKRSAIVFERLSPLLKTFKGKKITFWGITYKSGTPALTHSLPLKLAKEAVSRGSKIDLCDPWVNKDDVKGEINGEYGYFTDPYESVKSSNAIICITPWPELKNLNFKKIADLMLEPKILFDARNYFLSESAAIRSADIKYIGVGR